jgi:aminoglycoside phosphotransferase (APT) family kinase protein
VSDTPGLDLEAFRRWYDAQRPGELDGELSAEVVTGGKSNLTYVVRAGGRSVVVRRPPLGHVQATAHDMGREYTAMSALQSSAVPVPTMLARCEDASVIGAEFYVMERVDGTAYRRARELDALGPERTAALADRLVDVLAALHAVDPGAVGLDGFGRPQGYLERQVRRWGTQLEGSKTQERPAADELHRLLTVQVPVEDPADLGIVHGDYRLDNCLVGTSGEGTDEILAVVDWEMATLGDTRADLALMLVYDELGKLAPQAVSDVARATGYPTGVEQVAAYAAARGREVGDLGFHLALGYFKLGVILEGIHYRYLQGQTVGEGFDQIGAGFDLIIDAGHQALKGP